VCSAAKETTLMQWAAYKVEANEALTEPSNQSNAVSGGAIAVSHRFGEAPPYLCLLWSSETH